MQAQVKKVKSQAAKQVDDVVSPSEIKAHKGYMNVISDKMSTDRSLLVHRKQRLVELTERPIYSRKKTIITLASPHTGRGFTPMVHLGVY